MTQIARNLTDFFGGYLKHTRYLILDSDPLYTHVFRGMLKDAGVKVVRLPARSPDLNSYAERWIRSLRSECLSRVIPLICTTLREHPPSNEDRHCEPGPATRASRIELDVA